MGQEPLDATMAKETAIRLSNLNGRLNLQISTILTDADALDNFSLHQYGLSLQDVIQRNLSTIFYL